MNVSSAEMKDATGPRGRNLVLFGLALLSQSSCGGETGSEGTMTLPAPATDAHTTSETAPGSSSSNSAGSSTSSTGEGSTSQGEGSETEGLPPEGVACLVEDIPFRSALMFPDHTTWGDNMNKVARLGDRVFTFYSDNSGYCVPNAPPGVTTCGPGEDGLSYFRVLRKEGPDGPWESFETLSFPTVRPGNLVVAPDCVHAFVFEPHPNATRALDQIGGLKHYWFAPDFASDSPPIAGQEWVVPPPANVAGPENVNIRLGAAIAPDGRMTVAWGLPDRTMHVHVRDGGGCFGGGWTFSVAETNLDFAYYYPRVHVGGGPGQQYYTGIIGVMDEPTPTVCAGGPTNDANAPIYRKVNYWEDSRNGLFRRETVADLWNPCSDNDGVKHTEMYIDRASRSHVIFAELLAGGTQRIEHWIKPGDSFASDPSFGQTSVCLPSMPCQWTKKLVLDWKDLGINWVRLFERPNGDGTYALYYLANSWDRIFVGRVDEEDQDVADLVELTLPDGWRDKLGGAGLYAAAAGGGTSPDEPELDFMLPGAEATYYLRLNKDDLDALFEQSPRPTSIPCGAADEGNHG